MSPKWVIALFFVVSGGVVAAAVYSAVEAPRVFGLRFGDGCDLDVSGPVPTGAPQEAVTARREGDRWSATRVLTWRLPAAEAGEVGLCADTGGVRLEAGPADAIVLEATVRGWATTEAAARDAAQRLDPEVRLPSGGGVWAWHPAGGARYMHGVGATVSFRVQVPPQMLVHADLATDTGGVAVRGVRLTGLRAEADTGGIEIEPTWARGTLRANTDTGGVFARFASLESATMRLTADTGGIEVFVPGGSRHGYEVRADADTGGVTVTLPDTEDLDRSARDHRHVRTRGFESREFQVRIEASTDTGGVRVGVA